jgi:adenylate cyclase
VAQRAPQPLPTGLQFGLVLVWGLLLGALCIRLRAGYAVLASGAAGAAYVALAHMRFAASATWLPLVTPLAVQAPLALFGGLLWQFVQERRGRERLHELLRDVLSPAVIDHLLNQFRTVAGAGRELYGTFV